MVGVMCSCGCRCLLTRVIQRAVVYNFLLLVFRYCFHHMGDWNCARFCGKR